DRFQSESSTMWFASLLHSLKLSSSRAPASGGRGPKLSLARPRPRQRRPETECLEDRTLLTVQFTPGPYLTPANRPGVPLGVIGDLPLPIEPMLAVNSAEPGNIAVSSQNGVRITTNAGATFGPPADFVSPGSNNFAGDTDLKFDGLGRLFWSNLAADRATC